VLVKSRREFCICERTSSRSSFRQCLKYSHKTVCSRGDSVNFLWIETKGWLQNVDEVIHNLLHSKSNFWTAPTGAICCAGFWYSVKCDSLASIPCYISIKTSSPSLTDTLELVFPAYMFFLSLPPPHPPTHFFLKKMSKVILGNNISKTSQF